MLNNGATVNVQNETTGKTPLHIACEQGNKELTKFLLEQRADLNIRDAMDKLPAQYALEEGHHAISSLLMQEILKGSSKDT